MAKGTSAQTIADYAEGGEANRGEEYTPPTLCGAAWQPLRFALLSIHLAHAAIAVS